MNLLVLISTLLAATAADFQGYSVPTPPPVTYSSGGCKDREILHVDGTCVVPTINRRLFLYTVPELPPSYGPPPHIPPPKVDQNILFIRTPEGGQGPEPIIVPPPRQQHVVYVLNKQSDQSQRVIEVPAPPSENPEVYFVNYGEGDNPTLPGGIDFQTALNSAIQGDGQVIAGTGAGGSPGSGLNNVGVGTGFGGTGAFGIQSTVQTPGASYNPPTDTYNPPTDTYNPPTDTYNPPKDTYNP
ncbi:DNA-directed RNA polymerase II subunit rpb1-like, partial [Homarus americanus]|uniref:DNA-directed RNA polymerase II subunit rpb1-like n=1 Tax=Homarus americanus TaxID=6706 RepID=UPI001C49718E